MDYKCHVNCFFLSSTKRALTTLIFAQRVVGVRRWKKRWCVLEGKLLLYFKTQLEYSHHLSPCRGSVNMGLVLSVTPRGPCQLQIVTRSQIIIFVSIHVHGLYKIPNLSAGAHRCCVCVYRNLNVNTWYLHHSIPKDGIKYDRRR